MIPQWTTCCNVDRGVSAYAGMSGSQTAHRRRDEGHTSLKNDGDGRE